MLFSVTTRTFLHRLLLVPRFPKGLFSRLFMDLGALVTSLNDFASLSLAENWDNVGLLVEPSPPHVVHTVLLTNDLTEEVLEEAVDRAAGLILSYHPPIFRPLKHLTWGSWKERLVIRALENRVAIYSPHTAYDAVPQGVNDWLARALGTSSTSPLHRSTVPCYPGGNSYRVEFSSKHNPGLQATLSGLQTILGVSVTSLPARRGGEDWVRVSLSCTHDGMLQAVDLLAKDSILYKSTEVLPLQKPPFPEAGMGRLCSLSESISVATAVEKVKRHLGLSHLRLALGTEKTLESPVQTAAVCAGSGASVLRGIKADLYLTGEMSHHEVLDAVAEGTSVILCEHSNTERGFLRELRNSLMVRLEDKVQVEISEKDRDPLQII
ncbi:NIF3-like protein 1 [Microcaecilia unicolor]|uniref:NIF3-like protein 1 n=1 Tax=Microcaecilia unicolor TaxID=1415580 RepID=A0A6P7YC53_9AMPH|nr:NIF3-like protein 1 [Microcaecilia unicolor]